MFDFQQAALRMSLTEWFLRKATDVDTPLMLWALTSWLPSGTRAPEDDMVSLKKNEIAFLEIARVRQRGETKRLDGRGETFLVASR